MIQGRNWDSFPSIELSGDFTVDDLLFLFGLFLPFMSYIYIKKVIVKIHPHVL